jgi:anti-sigma factor RsiW
VTEPALLPHSRVIELLPWLVNGTLTGAEREGVEQHTRGCIACRRELKEQQRLHAAIRARRTVDVSAEAGFDRLNAQLDGSARRVWHGRISHATAARFSLAAAAGVAVLAILVWFTPLPELGANGYSTLATLPAGEPAVVDIVFADDTTAAEMQRLLDDIGGEIVAGPSTLGRYSVRVPGAHGDGAQLGELLRALSSDPRVRLAGRALTEVEP